MSNKARTSKDLIELFDLLDSERQNSLLDFAEYLVSKGDLVSKEIGEPEIIPRPEKETVVGAIKRLKASYHMIESMSVFSDASSLMTEHMVSGRDSKEVIDEMEQLFEKAYQELLRENA